jgi:thiol-disulfide isomerase/thioredoxin
MTAEYTNDLQKPKADLAKIQSKWIEDLEGYVKQFSGTRPSGEAMLQLAVSQEFAGEDDAAIKWYRQIIDTFPKSEIAEKANGAVRRLRIVGKPFELQGNGLDGRQVDLSTMRGRVVLVHYWATWCEPCKEDMKQMRSLLAKFGGRRFAIVGVNLDDETQTARNHVRSNRISWPQIHDAGGLESRLAKQMGVFTLPLTMLVDESGAVVNRQMTVEELEDELGKRLKKR